ncbi:MAG: universal stress protein [Alphaproteobacteria bacterium HGW-Alphaproteobacteria-2]|nr:MAG: universal stress protein [Alphaproteobacteria bacterium HGW-Alphaproteobacteria-2]
MGYKSILTVTTGATPDAAVLAAAAAVAEHQKAHLDVLCLGLDRVQVGYYFDTASPAMLEKGLAEARAEAQAAKAAAERHLADSAAPFAVRGAVVQIGAIPEAVGGVARFADLVVQGKPYGAAGSGDDSAAVLEAALFEGRAPVLVVPGALAALPGRRIVVAWNRSAEAMAAVRAALPLLCAADMVDLAIVDPPAHDADESDPGAELSTMLSRHGASVEVSLLPRTMPRVADTLLRHARDREADLLVMGAYGHSRLRETLFGGATRDMLAEATLPVLMAR